MDHVAESDEMDDPIWDKSFPLFSILASTFHQPDQLSTLESALNNSGMKLEDYQYDGYILLCIAMSWNLFEVARFLLVEGAVPVISRSCLDQLYDLDLYLEKYYIIVHIRENSSSPLHYAARLGEIELIDLMLLKSDGPYDIHGEAGDTPLHEAVRYNQLEAVRLLISRCDINSVNDFGYTPIMYSIVHETDNAEMLELLLHYNPDVNIPDKDGMTPLLLVTYRNRIDTARCLLEHGADIFKANDRGRSAFTIACEFDRFAIFKLLIDIGYDTNILYSKGDNLLHLTCLHGNVRMVTFIYDKGISANCENKDSETPLMFLCKHDIFRVNIFNNLLILLMWDANPNANNELGQTGLHLVMLNCHKRGLTGLDWVTALLEHGADPNMTDKEGISPLHLAVRERCSYFFSILLCYGADVHLKCNKGTTPLSATKPVPFCSKILETVIKWRTLGLVTVSDETLNSLHTNAPTFFRQFEDKCLSELSDIQHFSKYLYLLLTKPIDKIRYVLKYINKADIYSVDKFYSNEVPDDYYNISQPYSKKFPLYCEIMEIRYRCAETRLKLLQGCRKFSHWLDIHLQDCGEIVLSYLANCDLKSLSNL